MIVQDEIEIKINPRNRLHYVSKGYTVPSCTFRNQNPNKIIVKVSDLPKGSHLKVKCKCDGCGKLTIKAYRNSDKLCKTCSNRSRTGDTHYSYIHGNRKYSVYKYSAKKRGLEFKLTVDEFDRLISKECHYCGATELIGIDRKDNDKGYILSNVLSCCGICNRVKRDLPYDKFLNHIKKIYMRFRSP